MLWRSASKLISPWPSKMSCLARSGTLSKQLNKWRIKMHSLSKNTWKSSKVSRPKIKKSSTSWWATKRLTNKLILCLMREETSQEEKTLQRSLWLIKVKLVKSGARVTNLIALRVVTRKVSKSKANQIRLRRGIINEVARKSQIQYQRRSLKTWKLIRKVEGGIWPEKKTKA